MATSFGVSNLAAKALQIVLDEDESRAALRAVLGIEDEFRVSRETNAQHRLRMLSQLNASNACLRRRRIERGANALAAYEAMAELASGLPHRLKAANQWLSKQCCTTSQHGQLSQAI
jgi:hypothetical protein